MMSPQATLCAFILVVGGLSPLTDASEEIIHCQNLEYTGPIKEVIKMKPTKLAQATDEAAQIGQGLATDMVSAGVGGIPFVGAALSSLFDQLVSAYGGGDLSIESVYNSLQTEVAQLRKYMDQSIEDVKIDYIRKVFGTREGGILSYAKHCQYTYKDHVDELGPCLENLRGMLTTQYHFFLPQGETARSYEQTLPLFRMYGQLYVDTLLDQIAVAKKKAETDKSKESIAARQAEALIAKVKEFMEHTKKALKKIGIETLSPHVMPAGNQACARLPNGLWMCTCTIAIGPSKFDKVNAKGDPADNTKNWCVGVTYESGETPNASCETTKKNYFRKYARDHSKAVEKYWTKQLVDTVNKWGETTKALKPMVAKHKR